MRNCIFILLLVCIDLSDIQAQEASLQADKINVNKVAYSLGYSHIYSYYEQDFTDNHWKKNFWSHTMEYDRQLFPWLEAGGYFMYSMKGYEGFWLNMTGIGLNLKLHPIGMFYKKPTFVDVYGFFRGGINYRFVSNVSEKIYSNANNENRWYSYFSPGAGISFFNHKRVSVFLEYSTSKCFTKTYSIGMSCRF